MPPCQTARDLERMRQVVHRLVEQHVAEAAAEDHAEHAVEQHVVDVARMPAGEQVLPRAYLAQHDEQHEADQVHEPVPADGERARAGRRPDRIADGPASDDYDIAAAATRRRCRGSAQRRARRARRIARGRRCGWPPATRAAPSAAASPLAAADRRRRVRRMWRSDAGTRATPRPAETRLTIVCIWIASCAMRGVKPALPAELDDRVVQARCGGARKHDERPLRQRRQRKCRARSRQRIVCRQGGNQRLTQQRQHRERRIVDRRQQHARVDARRRAARAAARRRSARAARASRRDALRDRR